MKTKTFAFLVVILLLSSCSKSLVYSPSINLPNEILEEGDIDLSGGVELMPETRPEALGDSPTTIGLVGQIKYGISDDIHFLMKGWIDIQGREEPTRSGFAFGGQFIMKRNVTSRFIFLPRLGGAMKGDDMDGLGINLSVIYHEELSDKLSFYIGGGLLWGAHSSDKILTSEGEERLPMGYGFINHTGVAYEIVKGLRVNFELTPIFQINTFDKNQQMLLSPQIGIGYTFNPFEW